MNPYVTPAETKENRKKWYLEHIEHRKKYMEEYNYKNHDAIREKKNEYKKINKEKLAQQQLETHMCSCVRHILNVIVKDTLEHVFILKIVNHLKC